MQALTLQRMTADEFINWSIDRPDSKCYQLVDGEVFETAPERWQHAIVGAPLAPAVTHYDDPLLVVEVLSPSTRALDAGLKRADYFTRPSLRHYLIVPPDGPTVIHHMRATDGTIQTRNLTSGELALDPPGLRLTVGSLFGS